MSGNQHVGVLVDAILREDEVMLLFRVDGQVGMSRICVPAKSWFLVEVDRKSMDLVSTYVTGRVYEKSARNLNRRVFQVVSCIPSTRSTLLSYYGKKGSCYEVSRDFILDTLVDRGLEMWKSYDLDQFSRDVARDQRPKPLVESPTLKIMTFGVKISQSKHPSCIPYVHDWMERLYGYPLPEIKLIGTQRIEKIRVWDNVKNDEADYEDGTEVDIINKFISRIQSQNYDVIVPYNVSQLHFIEQRCLWHMMHGSVKYDLRMRLLNALNRQVVDGTVFQTEKELDDFTFPPHKYNISGTDLWIKTWPNVSPNVKQVKKDSGMIPKLVGRICFGLFQFDKPPIGMEPDDAAQLGAIVMQNKFHALIISYMQMFYATHRHFLVPNMRALIAVQRLNPNVYWKGYGYNQKEKFKGGLSKGPDAPTKYNCTADLDGKSFYLYCV
jgi:hypothetical protein